jgi:hypothetical protein
MSSTIVSQEGRVQLEHANLHLALNVAKMAIDGFSHATIQQTKYLIKKPRAEIQEDKKQGVQFPGHRQRKAVLD